MKAFQEYYQQLNLNPSKEKGKFFGLYFLAMCFSGFIVFYNSFIGIFFLLTNWLIVQAYFHNHYKKKVSLQRKRYNRILKQFLQNYACLTLLNNSFNFRIEKAYQLIKSDEKTFLFHLINALIDKDISRIKSVNLELNEIYLKEFLSLFLSLEEVIALPLVKIKKEEYPNFYFGPWLLLAYFLILFLLFLIKEVQVMYGI